MLNRDTAILTRTHKLLKQGWCNNALARDKIGMPTMPNSVEAVEWCLLGGLMRASNDLGFESYVEASRYMVNLIPEGWLSQYNNSHTKAEVLSLLDEAIEVSAS